MKRLQNKVNIIPVIAKADTMTVEECREFKRIVLSDIQKHAIQLYDFPQLDDEDERQRGLKKRVPFAVVGSNTVVVHADGRKGRGRVYPWGVVEVENLQHNDFTALRDMLIKTHMHDLKEITHNVHYENHRCNKLRELSLLAMEEAKRAHSEELKKKEAEMDKELQKMVEEKMEKLRISEAEMEEKNEQMRKSLEQQKRELEEKVVAFEKMKVLSTQDAKKEGKKEEKKKKKKGLF